MSLDLRDEIAARVAAGLASSTMDPRKVAGRAYAIADAMLRERAYESDWLASYEESGIPEAIDPRIVDAPFNPLWDLEPRWTRADIDRRDARVAGGNGPGLAAGKPDSSDKQATGS